MKCEVVKGCDPPPFPWDIRIRIPHGSETIAKCSDLRWARIIARQVERYMRRRTVKPQDD